MRKATLWIGFAALTAGLAAFAQAPVRTGEQIVKQQCAQCHEKGLHGAPRIDDRAAWVPRMKQGIDATVSAAIQGHGKMPVRGGMPQVTDAELRSAILYMFNPAGVPPRPPTAAGPGPNERVVDGTAIYLGVKPRKGQVHTVTITLRDAQSKAALEGAEVEVRVTNPVMGARTKKLEPRKDGGVPSYGAEFSLSGQEPHVIAVEIRRPGKPGRIEARFDYKS